MWLDEWQREGLEKALGNKVTRCSTYLMARINPPQNAAYNDNHHLCSSWICTWVARLCSHGVSGDQRPSRGWGLGLLRHLPPSFSGLTAWSLSVTASGQPASNMACTKRARGLHRPLWPGLGSQPVSLLSHALGQSSHRLAQVGGGHGGVGCTSWWRSGKVLEEHVWGDEYCARHFFFFFF